MIMANQPRMFIDLARMIARPPATRPGQMPFRTRDRRLSARL